MRKEKTFNKSGVVEKSAFTKHAIGEKDSIMLSMEGGKGDDF